ncbi:ferredoxin, 2Fe-2S [Polaromonas sp. OV174]|uniref:2Fe-2S iron-sulfur cluster-binding protein n=1 Tax=Polaromonas sp. OV174 TaxID=1855300 RepID=UPI0008E1A178|nr:2Fe-2S iron-sulfur cluster-binding protein [Polaromonas sp. OV174]SFC32694.1 ferredoxin, 2Fe-2S [Polaromonas sp. OV174]
MLSRTITLHFVSADGRASTISGKIGKSLMQAAVAGGISEVVAECGGKLTCATCHVYVREPFASDAAKLSPPGAEELAMLAFTAMPRQANSRLSCQIQLTPALDGLTLELPLSQY